MRGEVVTVLTPGGTTADPYSNEQVADWTTKLVHDCTTLAPPEPRPSGEPVQDARNSVTSGWTLYLPAGTPVTAHSRVRVRGVEYPVQGDPADWGLGLVVQAYRTEG